MYPFVSGPALLSLLRERPVAVRSGLLLKLAGQPLPLLIRPPRGLEVLRRLVAEGGVVSAVEGERAPVQMRHPGRDGIEKAPVM